jgi:hypothetical protein
MSRATFCARARVDTPGVPGKRAEQQPGDGRPERAARAVSPQHPALEHATPGALLGARQLADADAAGQVVVDHLIDTAGAPGPAQIPHVLVEQAVAEEHHPAPAGVRQLVTELSGPSYASTLNRRCTPRQGRKSSTSCPRDRSQQRDSHRFGRRAASSPARYPEPLGGGTCVRKSPADRALLRYCWRPYRWARTL